MAGISRSAGDTANVLPSIRQLFYLNHKARRAQCTKVAIQEPAADQATREANYLDVNADVMVRKETAFTE